MKSILIIILVLLLIFSFTFFLIDNHNTIKLDEDLNVFDFISLDFLTSYSQIDLNELQFNYFDIYIDDFGKVEHFLLKGYSKETIFKKYYVISFNAKNNEINIIKSNRVEKFSEDDKNEIEFRIIREIFESSDFVDVKSIKYVRFIKNINLDINNDNFYRYNNGWEQMKFKEEISLDKVVQIQLNTSNDIYYLYYVN